MAKRLGYNEIMVANIKETLHSLAERMPEDDTLEDAIERLRFLRAVEEGRRAAESGEFASDEELRRVFSKVRCQGLILRWTRLALADFDHAHDYTCQVTPI